MKRRVLFVNDQGYESGGSQVYMYDVARELTKRGHDVFILASNAPGSLPRRAHAGFAEVPDDSPLRHIRYVYNRDAAKALREVVKEFKPDIIHCNYIYNHTSLAALLAERTVPRVVSLHDLVMVRPAAYGMKGHPLYQLYQVFRTALYRRFLKHTWCIAPSRYMQSEAERAGFKRCVTVPNGVRPLRAAPLRSEPVLVVASALIGGKGVASVIEAMPAVFAAEPKATLRVIGDGPDRIALQNLALRLGLGTRVSFLGQLEHRAIARAYAAARVVYFPSLLPESFGLAGLEGMSVGRPVIATGVGGTYEWLHDGKNGYFVAPGDADAIARKTIRLLRDPTLVRKMSKQARSTALRFSLDRHVRGLEALYERIITSQRASR